MKNRRGIELVLWYILLGIKIILFTFLLYKTCMIYSDRLLDVLIYAAIGFVYSVIVSTFLHEMGHVIVGKSCGLSLSSFRFLWFKISFHDSLKKFSFSKMGNALGETVIYPTTMKNISYNMAMSYLGGLFVTFLYTVISIIVAIMTFEHSLVVFCRNNHCPYLPLRNFSASSKR